MGNEANYPEISFVETDTETIKNSLIAGYELITSRILYPADPVRVFISWVADVVIQQRILIDDSAKQNVPRYARDEYLDSIAEIFKDAYRLEAEPAKTTFRCYISTALTFQVIIPAGTEITVDGSLTFATKEIAFVKIGSLYVDVAAECTTAGTAGNGFVPGQIINIVKPYNYYEKVENITTSAGGTEKEDDSAFYKRMRESMESFSTAGPSGAYIYHAKTVSAAIKDVAVTSPERGNIDIRILVENGESQTEEIINQVKEALTSDTIRPLGDYVTVSTPDEINYEIELTYYIPKPSQNSSVIISESVEAAVLKYIEWQSEKMGRDINPSYLISLIMATGVKRVEVIKPTHTVITDTQVAIINTSIANNGGVEDE